MITMTPGAVGVTSALALYPAALVSIGWFRCMYTRIACADCGIVSAATCLVHDAGTRSCHAVALAAAISRGEAWSMQVGVIMPDVLVYHLLDITLFDITCLKRFVGAFRAAGSQAHSTIS